MEHTAHGWWVEEAGRREPMPALEGERAADVVVVGGGYTGMWAAWHLQELEPEARVVLLEADACGLGPSGRNGGFVNAMWFGLPNLRERFGAARAIEVARAAQRSVDEIGQFCEQHAVDAWYRRGGYLQVSAAPAQDGEWEATLRACREMGEPAVVAPLSAAEVARRCRSPRFREGALFPGAATVQPARLAFGLRERLAAAGTRIHEGSPVRRLRAAADGIEAQTPAGRVHARSCVLAIGGAGAARDSPLRGRLTVTSSHIALTEPVPDVLEELGWTGGECITDSRAMLHYMRTTADGRIAFGWGGGRIACGARLGGRAELDPAVIRRVLSDLRSFFPQLQGRRVEAAWGGPIDVSPIHLPVVLTLPGGRVTAAFGYTGNGVGPSHLLGRMLASLALDRRDEASRLALVDPELPRVPAGTLGGIGGNAIRAALVRKEAAEEAGRRPDPLSRALAALPELIGFHIGR